MKQLSILVVDDDPSVAMIYELYLSEKLGHHVEVTCSPQEARHLADKTLFDIVLCDAKMLYKASPLGGVLLAEELSLRLGRYSVLIVSQIVDENSIRELNTDLPFIKKPSNTSPDEWFSNTLTTKMNSMVKRQYGFVAMPFGRKDLDGIYKTIVVPAAKKAGFNIRRVDEEPFTRNIVNRIFKSIKESHFVVFITTENKPNVFYEAGFAHGLKKEVIVCAPDLDNLPFDIRSNICLPYKNKASFQKIFTDLLMKIRFFR